METLKNILNLIKKSIKSIFFKFPVETEDIKFLKILYLVESDLENIMIQLVKELNLIKIKKIIVLKKVLKLRKTDPARFEALGALKVLDKLEVVLAWHISLLFDLRYDVLHKNKNLIRWLLFLMWFEVEDKRVKETAPVEYLEHVEYSWAKEKITKIRKELSKILIKYCYADKPSISYPEEMEEPILNEYLSTHFNLLKSVWNKNNKLIKWLLFLSWVEYRIVEKFDYLWLLFLLTTVYDLWGMPLEVIWKVLSLLCYMFVIYLACIRFPPRS